MILLKLGLRPSEVAKLTLNCIHLQGDPTLIIKNSKRNKSRFLPIPPDTVQAIKDWLIIRNQSTKIYHQRSQYVFTSQRAEKMGERAIQRVVEKIAKKKILISTALGCDLHLLMICYKRQKYQLIFSPP